MISAHRACHRRGHRRGARRRRPGRRTGRRARHVPGDTGTPIVLGEWGGVWEPHRMGNWQLPSTEAWQKKLTQYLIDRKIGYFY